MVEIRYPANLKHKQSFIFLFFVIFSLVLPIGIFAESINFQERTLNCEMYLAKELTKQHTLLTHGAYNYCLQDKKEGRKVFDLESRTNLSEKENCGHLEIIYNKEVKEAIQFYQNNAREKTILWLTRSGRYRPMIEEILANYGLPRELIYLPFIESGFNPKAYSSAHAAGLWQFIKSTGHLYNLQANNWLDERYDPEKATIAAARHLRDLWFEFNSWPLALAAYNAGARGVQRAIERQGTKDFWQLRLPQQTQDYVPLFMAAVLIGENPKNFGFEVIYEPPLRYETINVSGGLSLKKIAQASSDQISTDILKNLNPELKKGCTPSGKREYTLKVPVGTASVVDQITPNLPKITTASASDQHYVSQGETLSRIARTHDISIEALMDANSISSPRQLKAGTWLKIPDSANQVTETSKNDSNYNKDNSNSEVKLQVRDDTLSHTVYTVKKGDTLGHIADRFSTNSQKIREWNNLDKKSLIYPGDKLIIKGFEAAQLPDKEKEEKPEKVNSSSPKKETSSYHIVKWGDSYYGIARQYGIKLSDLLALNSLKSNQLKPGDKIYLPNQNSNNSIEVFQSSNLNSENTNNEATKTISYTIKKGDTLYQIAEKYNTGVNLLMRWNNLSNSRIKPGDKLSIQVPNSF